MSGLKTDSIEHLRFISDNLSSDILAEFRGTLFPGWDEEFNSEQERLIREAAKGILAYGISKDDGTFVSQRVLAALIHYIADRME